MNQGKLELTTPDEAEAVFYEAFQRCDAKVMAALWADGDVVCVHPGAGAIIGHQPVLRSWTNIFDSARGPTITIEVARRKTTEELAVHLVAQQIATDNETAAIVLATNVYEKFGGGWLMTGHHASLVQSRSPAQTLQ